MFLHLQSMSISKFKYTGSINVNIFLLKIHPEKYNKIILKKYILKNDLLNYNYENTDTYSICSIRRKIN